MIEIPLTDVAWDRVSHLFPQDHTDRRKRACPRSVLNGILWVITRDEKWKDLPSQFPPQQTCYKRWLLWRQEGVFQKALDDLDLPGSSTGSDYAGQHADFLVLAGS
jgi:transposase